MGTQTNIIRSLVVALVVFLPSAFLIGWYCGPDRVDDKITAARRDASNSIQRKLINSININAIDVNLRYLASDTHLCGSQKQYKIAQWIRDSFREYGMDDTVIHTYNVLLSSPSPGKVSVVQRLVQDPPDSGSYTIEFQSTLNEPTLDEESHDKDITPAFSAYAPSGTVEGDLVYANYASVEDFQYLIREKGIQVTDKIIIARYGKTHPGDKAKFAAQFGAQGLILFSDPADYNTDGEQEYPDGINLPSEAILRGSFLGAIGDPLTPNFPAEVSAYRYSKERAKDFSLPTIPVHPISADDASMLLKYLGGETVEEDWSGNIPDLVYKYGPGFASPEENGFVKLIVHNDNQRKDSWNVIGTIFGEVEPDRFIVIGSHSDAWAFGAIDSGSGTATVLEIAKAFGKLKTEGWRPRRSIIFASWGAGELGQIGSNEWVEKHSKFLSSSSIAYLNVDLAVAGNFVPEFLSTPNLNDAIWQAAHQVPDPNPEEFEESVETVYDRWRIRSKLINDKPTIGDLASGSDYTPFLQISGVSALDFGFVRDKVSSPIEPFPLYHSSYDTYDLLHRLYDPENTYIQASARLLAEITRVLADSKVLPLNCTAYAYKIDEYYRELRFGDMGLKMVSEGGLTFQYMQQAVTDLTEKTETLERYIANELDRNDILAVRSVNDKLMNFERCFIDPRGIRDGQATRHLIFAPSTRNHYICDQFPGIVDAMFDIDYNNDPDKWEYVSQELAAVTHAINVASQSIEIPM